MAIQCRLPTETKLDAADRFFLSTIQNLFDRRKFPKFQESEVVIVKPVFNNSFQ